MTTIKDVAKKAGVSIAVVSKALNNYPDVSPKTRQRILQVAEEMHYSPNLVAKNLSSKKQRTIGLITSGFSDSGGKDSNNSFKLFSGVYSGIGDNYELAIYLTDSLKQKKKSYAHFCRERNIGGAILMGIRMDDPYVHELLDTNIPCVLVDIVAEEQNKLIGSVTSDNRNASQEITTYLLEKNHRDIVVVAGTKETYVNNERLAGAKQAYSSLDFTLEKEQVIYAQFSEEIAYEKVKSYLDSTDTIPTAFLCFSDLMAYGAMQAVKDAGFRIPEDISITGFDDLIISEYTQPPLTTMRQNFIDIGKQSSILLQDLMENNQQSNTVYVSSQFIERKSVQQLPNENKSKKYHK
ncbi:LacI family DNA-binding transcriptional regulator [Oceanobacillus jeddahense]|uniref:LacI family transcriptional regulator n=1 Tax=Oceanobacillus jeddahense TaxID=1462527 RepID=A0ABY5JMS0_9BACI|nr:LacI family DNA-binding transcriptional regulator [Oceanobacillus jeddahense]UUI01426.1 LacI family transcriptional regulator [Oceanobacillus jeddahense]